MALNVSIDWNKDGDYSDTSENVTSLVRRAAGVSVEYGRDQSTALAMQINVSAPATHRVCYTAI
jgi:hypothetical protein